METGPKNNGGSESAVLEGNQSVEAFAAEVKEEFKRRMVGESFTVTNKGRVMQITVLESPKNKEQAGFNSEKQNFLYVLDEEVGMRGLLSLSAILASPKAGEMISVIMQEKNIPTDMQAEVRAKILSNS